MLNAMFRWIARLLVLVTLAPSFGPLALASVRPQAMHCMRQPMSKPAAQSAMPCHHGMAMATNSGPARAESSEASFQAADNCCEDHSCCCAATSEFARPASGLLSFLSLLIEPACTSHSAILHSSDIFGQDSARAPPRS